MWALHETEVYQLIEWSISPTDTATNMGQDAPASRELFTLVS
jgi:hypothetical protein